MKTFYFLYLNLLVFSINIYAQDSTYDYSVCPYADQMKMYYEKTNPYQALRITPQSSPQEIDAAIERFKEHRNNMLALMEQTHPECVKLLKNLDEVKFFNVVQARKAQQ